MAAINEEKHGKSLNNYRIPKMEHQKLVLMMLRSPCPIICCVRAKHKTRQTKENGKTVIIKDDHTSPIQAEEWIFESTVHAEILQDHSIILTKCSHPDLRKCFPTREEGPLTIKHGELIAAWCRSPGGSADDKAHKALLKELWDALKPVRGAAKNWDVATSWLKVQGAIPDDVIVTGLSDESVKTLTAKVKEILAQPPAPANNPADVPF
jgi:hypothetical protein